MRGIGIISIIINAKYVTNKSIFEQNLFSKTFDTIAIYHAKKKKINE